MKEIKLNIVCGDCGGTGLYVGFAEKDGAAVICSTCEGTGCEKYEFRCELFKKRKLRKDTKRVFKRSCGYMHCPQDVTTEEGKLIEFSKAGCSYEEWLKGDEPKPVKELYCPYLWTQQRLQSKDKNNLYESRCKNGTGLELLISKCKYYEEKEKCWKIYEGKEK